MVLIRHDLLALRAGHRRANGPAEPIPKRHGAATKIGGTGRGAEGAIREEVAWEIAGAAVMWWVRLGRL